MVDYVEFPTDLVREIVLPKKEPTPPLPVPFPPGKDWGACGAYFWHDTVIYSAGLYSPQPWGMWMLTLSEEGDLIWVHMPLQVGTAGGVEWFVTPYLWYLPKEFIITVTTIPYRAFVDSIDFAFKLRVWTNPDVLSFDPCTVPPDQVVDGGPSFDTITVTAPPGALFMVSGAHSCRGPSGIAFIQVQAICPDQTDFLPEQPAGFPQTDPRWAIVRIGPPEPGSIFLP